MLSSSMLLDQLDRIYSSLRKRNRFQSLLRFLIREIANIIIPIHFKCSSGKHELNNESKVIVSLTTFPARISKIWLVIECILRQQYLPSKIILWLSKEQFPDLENDIPENLKFYVDNKLLELRFVDDDLRSHKKYYYALQEFPQDLIVTVDDDLFYSSNTIKDLVELYTQYPDSLCCLRGYEVDKLSGDFAPYKSWSILYKEKGPSFGIFHTSGGGALYKRSFFSEEVFNKEVFRKICFHADDIWLNIMLQINGTKTIKADFYSHLLPIKSDTVKLSRGNVYEGGNDHQIQAVIEYYNLDKTKLFE